MFKLTVVNFNKSLFNLITIKSIRSVSRHKKAENRSAHKHQKEYCVYDAEFFLKKNENLNFKTDEKVNDEVTVISRDVISKTFSSR